MNWACCELCWRAFRFPSPPANGLSTVMTFSFGLSCCHIHLQQVDYWQSQLIFFPLSLCINHKFNHEKDKRPCERNLQTVTLKRAFAMVYRLAKIIPILLVFGSKWKASNQQLPKLYFYTNFIPLVVLTLSITLSLGLQLTKVSKENKTTFFQLFQLRSFGSNLVDTQKYQKWDATVKPTTWRIRFPLIDSSAIGQVMSRSDVPWNIPLWNVPLALPKRAMPHWCWPPCNIWQLRCDLHANWFLGDGSQHAIAWAWILPHVKRSPKPKVDRKNPSCQNHQVVFTQGVWGVISGVKSRG